MGPDVDLTILLVPINANMLHPIHALRRVTGVRHLVISFLAGVLATGPLVGAGLAQLKEVFIPRLVYRTGPYASSGIPVANGLVDYYTLLNERDGGRRKGAESG